MHIFQFVGEWGCGLIMLVGVWFDVCTNMLAVVCAKLALSD